MKKRTLYIISGLIALLFILFTGWVGLNSDILFLHQIFFYFHLIPWGIGFTGGSGSMILLYYLGLWVVLTLITIPILKACYASKNRRRILISSISVCVLVVVTIISTDYILEKRREERILQNEEEDKKNFSYLKTGDIIFRNPADSGDKHDEMALILIGNNGYSVLETTDMQVQYSSLRSWIQKNENYTVKRLIIAKSLFDERGMKRFSDETHNYSMKRYDTDYGWSDHRMYDAEVVWKVYHRTFGVELCDLDTAAISSEAVSEKETDSEQYSVSPKAIFDSKKLVTIMEK